MRCSKSHKWFEVWNCLGGIFNQSAVLISEHNSAWGFDSCKAWWALLISDLVWQNLHSPVQLAWQCGFVATEQILQELHCNYPGWWDPRRVETSVCVFSHQIIYLIVNSGRCTTHLTVSSILACQIVDTPRRVSFTEFFSTLGGNVGNQFNIGITLESNATH